MASKFNLSQLMNDKSKSESGKETIAFKIDFIPIDKIQPSEKNKYSVNDVQELKLSIELTGLQQNLLIRQHEGADTYELISGHRRLKALQELHVAGNESFSLVPCKIIKSVDDIQAELQLIFANSTSRRLTDYEITYQAARLKELLAELKKGGFKFTGRKREVVAELLHVSPSQIGRMESINNNLLPELKEEFKHENISITTAYELSRLEGKQQEQALNEHRSGVTLTPEKVKQQKGKLPKLQPLAEIEPEIPSCPPSYCGTCLRGDCIHQSQEHEAETEVIRHVKIQNKLKPCPFCGSKASIIIVEPHTHVIANMPDYTQRS